MRKLIGIRREDKNQWERRVPIIPEHVQQFKEEFDIDTVIQPSSIRVFSDDEYCQVGAIVAEDVSEAPLVFAVKEIPSSFFQSGHVYVFFSHTIKGQKYNMSMLRKMMELKCTLIDYERIVDDYGRRLVFFGRYAGIAGMVDSLWAFGQRLKAEDVDTVFSEIKQTVGYRNLPEIMQHLQEIGGDIETMGFPETLAPIVVGFAGYGNVSKGAQEVLDQFPVEEIGVEKLDEVFAEPSNKKLYKVVFKEEDMVEPRDAGSRFVLQQYYQHPEQFQSVFDRYLPYLSILMNCIFWDAKYPHFVSKEFVRKQFEGNEPFPLRVVGDVSCDVNGAVEFTEKTTTTDNPVFVYNPLTGKVTDGVSGVGVVVMAVDNLPCELPEESSREFSNALFQFIPQLVHTDFSVDFDNLGLPPALKKAVILHKGKLTPEYQYIDKYL